MSFNLLKSEEKNVPALNALVLNECTYSFSISGFKAFRERWSRRMELSVLTLKDYLAESGEVSLVINFQITTPSSSIFMLYIYYKNCMSLKKKLWQIL